MNEIERLLAHQDELVTLMRETEEDLQETLKRLAESEDKARRTLDPFKAAALAAAACSGGASGEILAKAAAFETYLRGEEIKTSAPDAARPALSIRCASGNHTPCALWQPANTCGCECHSAGWVVG